MRPLLIDCQARTVEVGFERPFDSLTRSDPYELGRVDCPTANGVRTKAELSPLPEKPDGNVEARGTGRRRGPNPRGLAVPNYVDGDISAVVVVDGDDDPAGADGIARGWCRRLDASGRDSDGDQQVCTATNRPKGATKPGNRVTKRANRVV